MMEARYWKHKRRSALLAQQLHDGSGEQHIVNGQPAAVSAPVQVLQTLQSAHASMRKSIQRAETLGEHDAESTHHAMLAHVQASAAVQGKRLPPLHAGLAVVTSKSHGEVDSDDPRMQDGVANSAQFSPVGSVLSGAFPDRTMSSLSTEPSCASVARALQRHNNDSAAHAAAFRVHELDNTAHMSTFTRAQRHLVRMEAGKASEKAAKYYVQLALEGRMPRRQLPGRSLSSVQE